MTLSIELPEALEKRLQQEATEHGMDVVVYAQQLIERGLSDTLKTGGEIVAYWEAQGVLGAWADRSDIHDSAEYARTLRATAEKREHKA
ncbi:MAG TPA: hypothetical protein DIT99_21815 [Candidatus Latescibacteria bacterium]|jgi:hypothetical protein|nr:hypothetical protein [Candidatus Latescibacterota bacterium]